MIPTMLIYLVINLILFFPIFWLRRFLHEMGHILACNIFKIKHGKPNFNLIRHPFKGGNFSPNDEDWRKAPPLQKKIVLISSLFFEIILFIALIIFSKIIINKELLPIEFMILFVLMVLGIFITSFIFNYIPKNSDLHRVFKIGVREVKLSRKK